MYKYLSPQFIQCRLKSIGHSKNATRIHSFQPALYLVQKLDVHVQMILKPLKDPWNHFFSVEFVQGLCGKFRMYVSVCVQCRLKRIGPGKQAAMTNLFLPALYIVLKLDLTRNKRQDQYLNPKIKNDTLVLLSYLTLLRTDTPHYMYFQITLYCSLIFTMITRILDTLMY